MIGAEHGLYGGYRYVLAEWRENNTQIDYEWRDSAESDYSTDVLREKVLRFIDTHRAKREETAGETRPLFAYVAPTAPHLPLMAAQRHQHMNPHWASLFDRYIASRPNYYNETAVRKGKSSWLNESYQRRENMRSLGWNEMEFVKRMGSLYAVDEMIESVYRRIEALDELDNTFFILTSDNGYNLGAHGLIHKMAPYDER